MWLPTRKRSTSSYELVAGPVRQVGDPGTGPLNARAAVPLTVIAVVVAGGLAWRFGRLRRQKTAAGAPAEY